MSAGGAHGAGLGARARRVAALVRKETWQLVRDPSSIALGVALPVLLILLFGYGLSLDVENVELAVVLEDRSAEASALAGSLQLSPSFAPTQVASWPQARELMLAREVDGILWIRADFAERLGRADAAVELAVNGSDANRARIIEAHVQAALGRWAGQRGFAARAPCSSSASGSTRRATAATS